MNAKDLKVSLRWAAAISAYCFIATALTRYSDPENTIIGSYGVFRKLSIMLSFPSVVAVRAWGHEAGDYVSNGDLFTFLWLNLLSYTLMIFAGIWIWRKWRSLSRDPYSVKRRRLILGAAAGVGAVGGAVYLRKDIDNVEVVQQDLVLPHLPAPMRGWKLVLTSDWHRGPFIDNAYLEKVVELCNAQEPELMCVVGDFVYDDPKYYPDAAALVSKLRAKVAKLGTLGNHDHWQGAQLARQSFSQSGLRLLDNTRLYITAQGQISETPQPGALCIAGVGDCWADRVDYDAALQGVPEELPRLLLAHNPDCAEDKNAGTHRVDTLLAGHTHGGQVSLPLLGTILVPTSYGDKYVAGWAQGPHFKVYTTRGIGMTVLPIRSGARPEITVFTLK